jgi:radical SAM superfamily enzyme YgiQ (UPF0313 family)
MISGAGMKNKKLLLVSANRHTVPYPVYPLGISYLRSHLEKNAPGLEMMTFDFIDRSYDDYAACLREYKPDYTGISLRNIDDVNIYRKESFISHYRNIIDITRHNSGSVIITGGAGFSIYPAVLFDMLRPDFGICGEGEESLLQLMQMLMNSETGNAPGPDFSRVKGLIYRNAAGVTKINKKEQRLETPSLGFENSLRDYYWQHSGMLNIQTKRGCPYKCIYCTYPVIEGNTIRTLEVDNVVRTLSDLDEQGISYVFFTDSVFNSDNEYNNLLADKMISKKLKIRWGGYFNFSNIRKDDLKKYREAGLQHIEFGTESLSDTTLKNYRKPFRVKDVLKASEICNELDIHFAHFLILGGYGETRATLNETFGNSKKISNSLFFPFTGMRIYPGTWLHKAAIRENLVGRSDDLLEPVYYVSKNIEVSELKEMAKATGQTWIFPDDDLSAGMERLRKKNFKGPLWEYLIK